MTCCHRQNARLFLDNNETAVLIDNLYVAALELLLVALSTRYGHLHARLQLIVELGNRLAVHPDALSLKRRLDLRLGLFDILQQEIEKSLRFLDFKMIVFAVLICIVSHILATKLVQIEQNAKGIKKKIIRNNLPNS